MLNTDPSLYYITVLFSCLCLQQQSQSPPHTHTQTYMNIKSDIIITKDISTSRKITKPMPYKDSLLLPGSPPPLYSGLYNNGAVSMAARAC